MTQHVDEIAQAISAAEVNPETTANGHYRVLARAAMRAVVKQMREPSEAMWWAASVCIADDDGDRKDVWQAMLSAYMKEAGIDE